MKLKKLFLLAGAIAVAFTVTPLAANAQVNSSAPQRVSQARPTPPDLKLSRKQEQEIIKIRSNTRNQIQNVLTDSQRQQIKTDLEAGKNPQQVFASINFSQQQQNQLRSIMVNSQKLMENVLDDKQKKILDNWRKSQSPQAPKQ